MPSNNNTTSSSSETKNNEKKSKTTNNDFTSTSVFSMGLSTYRIPMTLFSTNRSKLCSSLLLDDSSPSTSTATTIVYLEGGKSQTRNDTDHEPIFRQESYFHYLFGVKEPDCAGAIHVESGKTVLFVPDYPKEYEWWMGRIKSKEEWRTSYCVDEVCFREEMEDCLARMMMGDDDDYDDNDEEKDDEEEDKKEKEENENNSKNKHTILLLSGINTDSNNSYSPPTINIATTPKLQNFNIQTNTTKLHPILTENRVIKSPLELSLLRHVTELTSLSHVYTMKHTKPNMMEYQCESLFRHYAYYTGGARHVGYTPICGCGPNGAVLHYGHASAPNDGKVKEGSMCLFDMGVEYCGYGSDVTCSFPANGVFTKKQKYVYEGVLNAQRVVYEMLKEGVWWVDCHKAAEGEILKALMECGIVVLPPSCKKKMSVKELVEMRLGAVFMPHGLGHLIGIDTHDVGGYLPGHPERIMQPGLKSLRTARILKAGMTITVEPGCYFIRSLLDDATSSDSPFCSFINKEVLKEYYDFGGVRLEDVVEITVDGCLNYTTCPRTVKEVEYVMSGGKWPPMVDDMPELMRTRLLDPNLLMGAGAGAGAGGGMSEENNGGSIPKEPPLV